MNNLRNFVAKKIADKAAREILEDVERQSYDRCDPDWREKLKEYMQTMESPWQNEEHDVVFRDYAAWPSLSRWPEIGDETVRVAETRSRPSSLLPLCAPVI